MSLLDQFKTAVEAQDKDIQRFYADRRAAYARDYDDLKLQVHAKIELIGTAKLMRELLPQHEFHFKRSGSGYIGICCWHEDHRPSLSLKESEFLYICFACGAKGNALTFVREKLGQQKPLLYLARHLGLAVPQPRRKGRK